MTILITMDPDSAADADTAATAAVVELALRFCTPKPPHPSLVVVSLWDEYSSSDPAVVLYNNFFVGGEFLQHSGGADATVVLLVLQLQ